MIIPISGKAEHGKDTFALELKKILEKEGKKVCIMHFGDYVKFIAKTYFEWDGKKDEKGRSLLQWVGTELIRSMDKYHWVKRIENDIKLFNGMFDYFLIPDTRFLNEVEYWNENNYDNISIRVTRLNFKSSLTDEQKAHISETELDDYNFDNFIEYETGIENVYREAEKFAIKNNLISKPIKQKLFVDFDNTIVNTTKAYVETYNELFKGMRDFSFVNWEYVEEYDFSLYCPLIKKFTKDIFETEMLFENLEFVNEDTKLVLESLNEIYDIYICSLGTHDNIQLKSKWIKENLPFLKNNILITQYKDENGIIKHDKSMIDMSNSIFIDDNLNCLDSSNADKKIVFGKVVKYNITDKYIRVKDWIDMFSYLAL